MKLFSFVKWKQGRFENYQEHEHDRENNSAMRLNTLHNRKLQRSAIANIAVAVVFISYRVFPGAYGLQHRINTVIRRPGKGVTGDFAGDHIPDQSGVFPFPGLEQNVFVQ